jgi:hypothetical protein
MTGEKAVQTITGNIARRSKSVMVGSLWQRAVSDPIDAAALIPWTVLLRPRLTNIGGPDHRGLRTRS